MIKIPFRIWGLLPIHIIMMFTFILPLIIVIGVSFSTRGPYGGFDFVFSVDAYTRLLISENWSGENELNFQYLLIIWRSFLLAGLTCLISVMVGFPVAYFIATKSRRFKTFLIFLVTLPFWVSMIIRVYSWIIILGNDGVIEKVVVGLGWADDMDSLLFNNGAMLVGMVYTYIPLMILPIFASVDKLDRSLIEASHDLYGGKLITLRRVIIPLSMPGIAAGAVLVFVPALGAVLEPSLLGGGKYLMMGNLIQNQFGMDRNWPFGAAIAIVLLSLVMIILITNALRAKNKIGSYGHGH